ncbi:MAG TPA: TIGR03067 domain-containing protein [Thermoguttaceae bacterium]|nr:TIGR03067 domain-containing protein [Thermoguttaceae bacterium]
MRSGFLLFNISLAVASAALILVPGSSRAETPGDLPLRDEFDSKLTLDWETIRPDPTHMSLETHPGKLTITTQYGSFHGSQTSAKNLLLIDVPQGMDDFVITTCIEDFLPETDWQQAGLLVYDGDDDHLKWVRDHHGLGFPVLNAVTELKQERYASVCPAEVSKERFWLRVTKRGDQYQCAASVDGKNFITYCVLPWPNRSPKRVGLVAKNGPREGDKEAQFDFFELRNLTDAERKDPVYEMRRALLGKWKAVDRQFNGKALTKGPATLLIAKPGTLILQEKSSLVVSYTVDPTTTPNGITLIPRQHGVGQLLNGVFSLDGDTLTLCLNPKLNGQAPDSLESVEGDGHMFLRLERYEDGQ